MVGRISKPDNQIFKTLVWKQMNIDCLPRDSAVESGLRTLYRLTKITGAPKETASGRMAIFLCMVVALAGLEEIAFAFCFLTI